MLNVKSQTLHFIFFCLNFDFMQLFLKRLCRMTNSVDPDQNAPSDCTVYICILSETLFIRNICVQNFRTFTICFDSIGNSRHYVNNSMLS